VTFAIVDEPTLVGIRWSLDGYQSPTGHFNVSAPDLSSFAVAPDEYVLPVGDYTYSFHADGWMASFSDYGREPNAVIQFHAGEIPEPCAVIVWSLLGAAGVAIGWWSRKRMAA
jgi:hypothetical protein